MKNILFLIVLVLFASCDEKSESQKREKFVDDFLSAHWDDSSNVVMHTLRAYDTIPDLDFSNLKRGDLYPVYREKRSLQDSFYRDTLNIGLGVPIKGLPASQILERVDGDVAFFLFQNDKPIFYYEVGNFDQETMMEGMAEYYASANEELPEYDYAGMESGENCPFYNLVMYAENHTEKDLFIMEPQRVCYLDGDKVMYYNYDRGDNYNQPEYDIKTIKVFQLN